MKPAMSCPRLCHPYATTLTKSLTVHQQFMLFQLRDEEMLCTWAKNVDYPISRVITYDASFLEKCRLDGTLEKTNTLEESCDGLKRALFLLNHVMFETHIYGAEKDRDIIEFIEKHLTTNLSLEMMVRVLLFKFSRSPRPSCISLMVLLITGCRWIFPWYC